MFKKMQYSLRETGAKIKGNPLGFIGTCVVLLILLFGSLLMLYPFLWTLGSSFKSYKEILTNMSVYIIPKKFTLEAYKRLNEIINVFQGFKNTMFILIPQIVVGTITSCMGAFGYTKLKVPCKNTLFLITLSAFLLPGIAGLIPEYIMWVNLGFMDTPYPLIISGLFGNIGFMFFVKEYLTNIPDAYFEAAKIDGASAFGQFTRIMIPLCMPAIGTQMIFWGLAIYNDVLAPDIYLHTLSKKTLQVMLKYLSDASGGGALKYQNVMLAAAVLASLPVLIIYALFQKYFMAGVTIGGIKE